MSNQNISTTDPQWKLRTPTNDGIPWWRQVDDTEIGPEDFEAVTVGDELRDALTATPERPVISVRPSKDNGGIEAMTEVMDGLPSAVTGEQGGGRFRSGARTNVSPHHAFEIRYARPDSRPDGERVLSLNYVPSAEASGRFKNALQTYYPECQVETDDTRRLVTGEFLPAAEADEELYASVSSLTLRRYDLYPIKSLGMEGFRTDPMASVVEEMASTQADDQTDADVVVQLLFRPAHRTWQQGIRDGPSIEEMTQHLRSKKREWVSSPYPFRGWWKMTPPSDMDKKVAKVLGDQDGRGWELCARVVALSTDASVAQDRCRRTAEMFGNYYHSKCEQSFRPVPLGGDTVTESVRAAAERAWGTADEIPIHTKGQREISGLVNIPTADDIQSNKMPWALTKTGGGVPPGTPRFDFQAAGVPPTASKEEKQLAMLDAAEDGEPFWFGLGVRHGVEAGQFTDIRNPHMFVVGESGVGKTTFVSNKSAQEYDRSGGGLRIDPNGDDTDDWMYEWPDDKPAEDCIYMDLSGDHDLIPRFNFLEVPDYLEPGTRKYNEFLEALAEDILAMVGEAGGTDNYVGGLMKRVVKTVVRAMGKDDKTATLFDLAAVCSSQENLQAFSEQMPEDRLQYLRDRVRSLAERDDSQLDPLAGRLDEWVLNPNVRELICARDPSFSVEKAVREGRHIFVCMSDSGTDIVKQMVGSALITRTYFAQRFNRPDHPFDLVVDEAQTILSSASDIENIMDQGRKFGYSVTLACQRPDSQFSEDIRSAITGNAATTIGYQLGNRDEARAVDDQFGGVDASDMTNIGPYRFYMSTETDENIATDGYLCEAFRAPSTAREMVADETATVADGGWTVDELQEASLDIYGMTVSEDDVRYSVFEGVSESSPGEQVAAAGSGATDAGRHALRKAAYDAALVREGEHTPVSADAVSDLLSARGLGDEFDSQFWDRVDRTPHVENVDGKRVRCTPEGSAEIFASGSGASAGSGKHRKALRDLYHGLAPYLVPHGGEVVVVSQDSDCDDDVQIRLGGMFDAEFGAMTPDEIRSALDEFEEGHPEIAALTGGRDATAEVESSTRTKPYQTCMNLVGALDEDRRCVFAVRPEHAETVWGTLTDPPYVSGEQAGHTKFYNGGNLSVDGAQVYRPGGAAETVWRRSPEGTYVLTDSDGTEHARFTSPEELFTDRSAYPDVGEGDGDPIKRPFIPEYEFGTDVPDTDAWDILTVPQDADDGLGIVVEGDVVPLDDAFDGDESADVADADGGSGDGGESGDVFDELKNDW